MVAIHVEHAAIDSRGARVSIIGGKRDARCAAAGNDDARRCTLPDRSQHQVGPAIGAEIRRVGGNGRRAIKRDVVEHIGSIVFVHAQNLPGADFKLPIVVVIPPVTAAGKFRSARPVPVTSMSFPTTVLVPERLRT